MWRKIIIIFMLFVFSLVILPASLSFSADDEITYVTVLTVDIDKNHQILWKIFSDPSQDSSKLIGDRNIRTVFVGRYDDFKELFEEYSYSSISVYNSPYQAKVLLIDHYFNKLIKLNQAKNEDKVYLMVNNFKKDYFNLYPHVYYKTPRSKKKSIIPNKLFSIDFFEDEKYIDAYQELFDAITDAVSVENVENISLLPKLLDETSEIILTDSSNFNFYRIEAKVDEIMIKEAFGEFFDTMRYLLDIINITDFYKTKYLPKKSADMTPLRERIVSVNVLYNPDTDFDYYEMEYAKKGALLHEYFYMEGLIKSRISPVLKGGMVELVEVERVYNKTICPDLKLFKFEDEDSLDSYFDVVTDFYDSLDDIMEVNEEIISSDEFDLEIIKLTATLDEVALSEMMESFKEDIKEHIILADSKKAASTDNEDDGLDKEDEE